MHADDLTLAEGLRWSRRVPTSVLTLGPTVVAVLGLASIWNEPGGYSGDMAQVTSWGEMLAGLPLGAAVAALALGWFAPRLGAWTMAAAMIPAAITGTLDGEGAGWIMLVAWAWIGIVVLDLVLVLRQRALAPPAPPRPAGPARWRADHHLGVRLVAAVLLTAAIATLFTWWFQWRGDALALAERAVPVETTVTEVDSFFDTVYVEVDGTEREFFVNDTADHPVGSAFVVFTDPTGRMDPYAAEDADPAGWSDMGLPLGAGLLLLGVVTLEIGRRRRRVERIAEATGGLRVRVLGHPVHDGFNVFAVDDVAGERPLVFLPALEQLVPRTGTEPTGIRGAIADLGEMIGAFLGVRRPDPAPDTEPGPAGWDDDPDGHHAPGSSETIEATLVGLTSDGSLCVLHLRDEGTDVVVASVRPARDPNTVRTVVERALGRLQDRPLLGVLARLRERESSAPAGPGDLEDPGPPPAAVLRVIRLLRSLVLAGPVLLALLGLVALPWLLDGEGLGIATLVPSAVIATVAVWWWNLGRDRIVPSRWGLRLTLGWLDHLVLPDEIGEVRRLADAVVIELDGDDSYELGPVLDLDETDQQAELDLLVATVNHGRERAHAGALSRWERHWPRRLPSSATLVGLVVFACWVVPGY